jgi:hypothetical protein
MKHKVSKAAEVRHITWRCIPEDKAVYVRFEVSTAVTMMIIIFWEMIIIKAVYDHRCENLQFTNPIYS